MDVERVSHNITDMFKGPTGENDVVVLSRPGNHAAALLAASSRDWPIFRANHAPFRMPGVRVPDGASSPLR